jgi:DNA-directed RNA polymerase subunit RPC12/RpoP
MKRKILTVKNQAILYKKLKAYLEEILKGEEYFNSFEDLYKDAYRVKVYGRNKALTPNLIADWLMGLPIGIEFATYKICLMLLEWLNIDKNQADKLGEDSSIYLESQSDLDNFYWNMLGRIIYKVALGIEDGDDTEDGSPKTDNADKTVKKYNRNKVKYICPDCGAKVWGKPGLHIECSDCACSFEEEEHEDTDEN